MKKDIYNLTTPQMSIFLSDQFTKTPINNIGGTAFFTKDINIDLLKKSVNISIKNNEAMRTIIINKNDKPMQYFEDFKELQIEVVDFSKNQYEDFVKFQKKFVQKKFKLFKSRLYRFVICILPNDEIALVCNLHHIIADAWSLGLLVDSIALNYTMLSKKQTPPLNSFQYKDFIKREEKYILSDKYLNNKKYWVNSLKNISPANMKNSIPKSFKANRKSYNLTEKTTNIINDFCKNNNISPYVLFLSALNIYLYKISSTKNFTIQTPVFNRVGSEKNSFGMFINMISTPMHNNNNMKINELLKKVSLDSFSNFKNSKYPYIHLLKNLRNNNNNAQNYNIVYSFQKSFLKTDLKDIIPYRNEWVFPGYMQDQFVINVTDFNYSGIYSISYDYLIDLFNDTEIDFIHKRIMTIIYDIIDNIDKTIKDICILPNEEKELLKKFNNTDTIYDNSKTLIDLFEETVNKSPNSIALIFKDKNYTYKELNNMANIVANKIVCQNIKNSKISILCKKSAWMVASLLGIMKSGNCYIPIDAEYPSERINYILKNSNSSLIITSNKYKDIYDIENSIFLEDLEKLEQNQTVDFSNLAKPDSLAYIIYTSGTTGKPKGVKIKHKNIINTLNWRKNYYNFNKNTTVLQVPSFSFDSSVEDIFTPLISGGKLVIPEVSKTDINIICKEIVKHNVNHFLVVPSLYKILLREKINYLKSLQFITIAGESFPNSLVKEHFKKLPNVRLINEYGPTENSVCSTFYELTKKDKTIFIGKPISNCKCYCLDNNLDYLPIGVPGELYVSGPGVSEGYLNNSSMTHQRFLKNPFDSEFKMYKTGDIVCRNFDGNLEFIGRDDGQVKYHGFRIELKEIEKNILNNENVSDCSVLIRKTENNSQKIVAYITTYKNNFDLTELYESLRKTLPFYMIPIIVKLDSFPLTPNGKLDKEQLPIPDSPINGDNTPKPPRNKLENTILEICKSVLEKDDLGVTDDLFTVGGADSLDILTINSKLFVKDLSLDIQDFYIYTTVEKISKKLSKKTQKNIKSDKNFIKPKITRFPSNISKDDLSFNYKNVFLTGVTGFLGIHILDYLLKNTKSNVYCIIRKKDSVQPYKRLKNLISYYFNNNYYDKYKKRIYIIDGELSEKNFGLSKKTYEDLQTKVDVIINTAANTKHYGNHLSFENENVDTVKNLILFAKKSNIVLNHMSTTTISGNHLVENNISYNFTENDFYIGQNYKDNIYIYSKFKAEKLILEEELKGLKANIFRLGNLMARYDDGLFQKNKLDNSYFTRLLALAKLGCLPENLKDQMLEFSPIDKVSEAIIKLLTIPNLKNNIFHIFSNKLISINEVIEVFKEFGIECEFKDYDNFIYNLHLQKNEKILKYIISDLNNSRRFDYSSNIAINQHLTNKFLKLVDFEWPEINKEYLKRFFTKTNFTYDFNI